MIALRLNGRPGDQAAGGTMPGVQHRPAVAAAWPATSRRPILVTGSPRSGSTWIGNVLALAPGTGYLHEPFNTECPPGICRAGLGYFAYVTEGNEAGYLAALQDTLAWHYSSVAGIRRLRTARDAGRLARDYLYFDLMRRRHARVIVKDPLAIFSADWLARRFDTEVVVVIRHPASFVASMRAAGYLANFALIARQPQLLADRLGPYADRIAAAAPTRSNGIEAITLLWTVIHHHIARLQDEHPEWSFVRHEDLSLDPVGRFASLFSRLDLDFSPAVRTSLGRFTTGPGPLGRLSLFANKRRTFRDSREATTRFRERLTPEEIARIRADTAPVWQRFYGDRDW
jgi:hypothetical protein